jgi:hypothetical protein
MKIASVDLFGNELPAKSKTDLRNAVWETLGDLYDLYCLEGLTNEEGIMSFKAKEAIEVLINTYDAYLG